MYTNIFNKYYNTYKELYFHFYFYYWYKSQNLYICGYLVLKKLNRRGKFSTVFKTEVPMSQHPMNIFNFKIVAYNACIANADVTVHEQNIRI